MRPRLNAESELTNAILETVIGLLDGPGAVKELDYGTYILLQPEWINTYAQAVIRTLRQDPTELGCLPLRTWSNKESCFFKLLNTMATSRRCGVCRHRKSALSCGRWSGNWRSAASV